MSQHDESTIQAILLAQRAITRTLHETSTSWLELNVSMAQLKTLIVLNDEGPLPVGQVGCRMGVTLPTASYQVDRLVRAGLVDRVQDDRDRRRTLVHLTEKATELVRSLRQGRADLMRSWLDHMSSSDVAALQQGLTALATVATEHQSDPQQPDPATITTPDNGETNGQS